MVRFFSLVAPGSVGDVGYAYLTAIAATGARVRALPIGPAAALGFEARWWRIGHLFTVPLDLPFVNVVCAPIGMSMGMHAPVSNLGTEDDLPTDMPPNVREFMLRGARRAKAHPDKLAYEPQTVLAGLYTVGCKNVAIVAIEEGGPMPDARELAAIAKYDRVLVSSIAGTAILRANGIEAAAYFRADHITLTSLEEICGCASGTFATTVGSPATPALPATTSSPSMESTTSSSRSPSSATTSQARSLAIRAWTPWRLGSISAWASQKWRSITRRLAFWRH
jgi:hypothetical protein